MVGSAFIVVVVDYNKHIYISESLWKQIQRDRISAVWQQNKSFFFDLVIHFQVWKHRWRNTQSAASVLTCVSLLFIASFAHDVQIVVLSQRKCQTSRFNAARIWSIELASSVNSFLLFI